MSDNEDLELQALQRQLDDAFETTRPRVGFEDELWSRMQAHRPVGSRIRDFLTGLVASVREAPRVPATAVAVVLVLAIGVGILSFSGFHFGGGGTTSGASTALRDQSSGGARYNAAPGAFGQLPVPAADSAPPKATNQATTGPSAPNSFIGPVSLVWAGHFNFQVTNAPVYRYSEPSEVDADQFASSLGAMRQQGQVGAGILGFYFGDGFTLEVIGSNRSPIREPFFAILPDTSRLPAPGPSAADTANAFLAAHSLLPTWPYEIAVDHPGGVARVSYHRQFAIPEYGLAYLVDHFGERYGLEVDLHSNQSLQASGPVPVKLDAAAYPVISGDRAVRMALSSSPAGGASPIPTVRLTSAELVYALVIAGDHSFYEPAYLFSGTFTSNGTTYLKRVLVPAVDPSQRSS